MRQVRYIARTEDLKNAFKVLVGNLEGKQPLGRPRCILEDNIKMSDLELDSSGLREGPVAGTCE
jgi:hypothetical protein